MELNRGQVVILTGGRGSGKSTACQTAAERATSLGFDCAGIASPARFVSRRRVGSDVVDVRTGERRPFATEVLGVDGSTGHRFDERVGRWACEVLARACPCDLLLVDEIGPLELERGLGWTNAIEVLTTGPFAVAAATVRPRLVTKLLRVLLDCAPRGEPPLVLFTPEEAPDRILGLLESRHAELGTSVR